MVNFAAYFHVYLPTDHVGRSKQAYYSDPRGEETEVAYNLPSYVGMHHLIVHEGHDE